MFKKLQILKKLRFVIDIDLIKQEIDMLNKYKNMKYNI